jgi:DNA-binding LacI/PurR family transcriptional regulator
MVSAVQGAPRDLRRRTTLADVALAAGVSQSTASRALSDSPLVNADTRRRVWEVAGRLRFRPNHLASSLRRGATLTIGLVVPDVGNAFFARALKAAQEALKVGGYHVLVIDSDRSPEGERAALDTMRAHRVDGLIVATSGGYEDVGVPVVFFDTVPEGNGVSAVAMDNAGGVGQLVEHLARVHGHERIGFIGSEGSVGRERLDGFGSALARAGLPARPERIRLVDLREAEVAARAAAHALLALPEPPTALVVGADTIAAGTLRALRDADRRVPADVALASFDELVMADLLDPPVTSLDRHDAELGRRSAELLLSALHDDPRAAPEVHRVAMALHPRRSCGCGA